MYSAVSRIPIVIGSQYSPVVEKQVGKVDFQVDCFVKFTSCFDKNGHKNIGAFGLLLSNRPTASVMQTKIIPLSLVFGYEGGPLHNFIIDIHVS